MLQLSAAQRRSTALVLTAALLWLWECPQLAQGDSAPERARLIAERGARFTPLDDGFEIRPGSGLIYVDRPFTDVRLSFQFQLSSAEAEADALVRFWFRGSQGGLRGYRVHLNGRATGKDSAGSIGGLNLETTSTSPVDATTTPPLSPADWNTCEILVARDALDVRINGALVSTVRGLTEWGGHIAFEAKRDRVRFRKFDAEPLALSGETFGSGAEKLGPGITDPSVAKHVRPYYTARALGRRIQGEVLLEAVVREDGTIGDIRVTKSLDRDLDVSALAAARQWRFSPATRAGQPIAVIVTIAMAFKIMAGS